MTDLVERYSVESLLLPDSGARVMQPTLRRVDVHWHDYYELSLVLEGEAEHVVNGRAHRLGPGSAFLLSPADFHSIEAAGDGLVCFNTVIDPELMERRLDALGPVSVDAFPWLTDDFADGEADLRRLREEFERPRLGSAGVTEGLVACLVVELARRCGVEERGPERGTRGEDDLRSAVLYVDRHFREPITLAAAAAQAHLSPNWFSERFREHTGTSFQSYLQERRLRFARSLLAATSLTVTEVCHASGFGSLSHFGRAYRRRYGEPPSRRSTVPDTAVTVGRDVSR
jgi:AraC-like DNA-binding protein/mannose-6-phosphate isomerase-like protein (cupin superfamily)